MYSVEKIIFNCNLFLIHIIFNKIIVTISLFNNEPTLFISIDKHLQ